MSLASIIRRRLIFLVFVVFGVSVVTFAISHLIPGDPARMMAGERATEETVTHIRKELGLDRPVPEQYVTYIGKLLHGDFGISIRTQRPVFGDLRLFFPATIELEYKPPAGSDSEKEVAKCLQYAKDALA